MRILIIADLYPSDSEPVAGVFIKEQVDQLRKYHDVLVLVAGRKFVRLSCWNLLRHVYRMIFKKAETERTTAWKGNEPGVIRFKYPVFTLFSRQLKLFSGASAFFTLSRELSRSGFRPGLIYAHKSYPSGYLGWKLKKRLNIPVVTMEFQGPFSGYFRDPYQGRKVIDTINNIDRTVYTSFQVNEIRSYGIKDEKLGNAFFGIDTNRFSPDIEGHRKRKAAVKKGDVKLLVVGRIEKGKGLGYLLEAVRILSDRYAGICLDIIGPVDSGGREILDSISKNGLERNVRYRGICSNGRLPLVINSHDILVSASLHETLGVTIMEAMACGKPVVATRCGGPEETVNSISGVLVNRADANDMAGGISHVIEHYEDYDPEKIREYAVRNFSNEVAVKKLNTLFNELVTTN